jgi:hypothetical protein
MKMSQKSIRLQHWNSQGLKAQLRWGNFSDDVNLKFLEGSPMISNERQPDRL